MNTLKKFIHYYGPYKTAFLLTFSVQLSLVLWISLIHRFFGLQQKHSSRRIKASFFMHFHGLASDYF